MVEFKLMTMMQVMPETAKKYCNRTLQGEIQGKQQGYLRMKKRINIPSGPFTYIL